MSIVLGVLLGIAFYVAILVILKKITGERQIMSYSDYLRDYGSIADSNPELYSNYNDYM
ncbi:MAG: hypothetical protein HOD92_22080 [Deltaproteobacteria bacterium]|jgi:hypothetical protein|nr:hypothetical protein [Deltaproteobacteria bacterium]